MSEPEPIKNDPELDEVLQKCLDAPGFVLFCGILTPRMDAEGRNVLEFKYIRKRFTFEDTSIALKQMKNELVKEVEGG